MINFIFPKSISRSNTSRCILTRARMDSWSFNMRCAKILCFKCWRSFVWHVLFSNPNWIHFSFFPISEKAQEILSVHNCIKYIFFEQRVPWEIFVNWLVYHKLFHKDHGHRCYNTKPTKVEKVIPKVWSCARVQSFECSVWKNYIKLSNVCG